MDMIWAEGITVSEGFTVSERRVGRSGDIKYTYL